MFCSQCGTEVENSVNFCPNCGAQTGAAVPAAAAGTPPPPQNAGPTFVQPSSYLGTDQSPLNIGTYLIILLLQTLPVVNLIVMLIWAVSGPGTNVNKRNFARAQLIIWAIEIVIGIVLLVLLGSALSSLFNGYSNLSRSFNTYNG